jgi:DNA primase catalytic subunit
MRFFIEMGWPRLDTQVTVRKNQSLRMPFSIHSSTGRISLPLNSIQAQQPRDMPLVQQVLKGEVDAMRQWNIGLAALEVWLNSCGYKQA